MTQDRPRRVALWCAVSTPDQMKVEKDSLPSQERAGREWAEAIGGEVVKVFSVPGHSRRYSFFEQAAEALPMYQELREWCERQAFDVLWTRHRDRLGRTMALIAYCDALVREIGGAEVYSEAMPHQLGKQSSRSATLMAAVESWSAEAENVERAKRMRIGMAARIRRGLFATHPPTGYQAIKNEDGQTVAYELDGHARALEYLTALFLNGHSYAEIQRRMDASPYNPPGGGDSWPLSTVRKIMLSDGYAGFPSWGDVAYSEDTPSPHYPALWDADTYAAILKERRRRGLGPYHRTGSGLFRGVVFCKRCQEPMVRSLRRKRGVIYYRCRSNVYAQMNYPGAAPCHANYVDERQVIEVLQAWCAYLIEDEDNIDTVLARWPADQTTEHGQAIQNAETLIADLDRQRKRLAVAYASGKMDIDIYRDTDDDILASIDAHRVEIAELRRLMDSQPDVSQARGQLMELAERLQERLYQWEPAALARMLQSVGLKVWVENGQVLGVEVGPSQT